MVYIVWSLTGYVCVCVFVRSHFLFYGTQVLSIAQKSKHYWKLFTASQPIYNHHKKNDFHTSMLNVKHTATPTMTATSAKATAATHPKKRDSPK